MKGPVKHVGNPGSWTIRYNVGDRPLQRCPKCAAEKRRPSRWWLTGRPLPACPRCGGDLVDEVARQERVESGFRIKKDAQDALHKRLTALNGETDVPPSKVTFGEYLTKEWLPSVRLTQRPLTFGSYKSIIETHVVPKLGAVRLQKLTTAQLNAFYTDLLATPRSKRKDSKPLAASTVRLIHTVIHKALEEAVDQHRRVTNPAHKAKLPPNAPALEERRHIWTGDQLGSFLASTADDQLGPLWDVMANTGVRRGEALGLKWSAVDLDVGRISIVKALVPGPDGPVLAETKTDKSRRTVPLVPETIDALKRQAAQQLEDATAGGEAWAGDDYVFANEVGQALNPDWVSHEFAKAVKATRLPYCRLHDLRHGYATRGMQAGVSPKVMAELLGHTDVRIVLNRYSHVMPGMSEDAATLIAAQIVRPSKDSR